MVGVADVTAHGHAQQLAAKVVFQPGAEDLLAVVEVFRANKAHHGVDQQGLVGARHGVSAGFDGLLIAAVVGVGRQSAALAGLEIHRVLVARAVVEQGTALQRQRGLAGLGQH